MLFIYNVFISIINILLPLIACFIPKLQLRNKEINKSYESLAKLVLSKKTIWFHSASMGEFEQAKPIIEFIKTNEKYKDIQIVCTFFSSSGYNTQKKYEYADAVCYLPFDTYWKAKKFIDHIKTDVAVFIRYELWLNYLSILQSKNIPTFLINSTFPTSLNKNLIPILGEELEGAGYQIRGFAKYFYKNIFNQFTKIYTVSAEEQNKFLSLNLHTEIIKSSDTRIDRIIATVAEAKINPVIQRNLFSEKELIFIAGSVWNKDIDVICDCYIKYQTAKKEHPNFHTVSAVEQYPNIRLIFVPHEPTNENIQYIQAKFDYSYLLSEILDTTSNFASNEDTTMYPIIVDSIGKLLKLYGIADFVYIGGAFGVGVHSITEPAGYGIPLVTGPNCFNSPDTKSLLKSEALSIINNSDILFDWLCKMISPEMRTKYGQVVNLYIQSQSGASKIISEKILDEIYKTSN